MMSVLSLKHKKGSSKIAEYSVEKYSVKKE